MSLKLSISSRWRQARGGGGGGSDDVEDAEAGVGVSIVVAGDEVGKMEFVGGVEADAAGQMAAECDLADRVEGGQSDAVELGGVGGDDVEAEKLTLPIEDENHAELSKNAPYASSLPPDRHRHTRRGSGF